VRKNGNLLKMLASTGYLLGIASLITTVALGLSPVGQTFAQGNEGAIWTTTETCGDPQNVNQYEVGDSIYINGANFTASVTLPWDITRVSGGSEKPTVATGSLAVGADGTFCTEAYQIQASDAGFTYQASVGDVKSDNFRVEGADATATFTPTSTPTSTPTATATNTPEPTATNTPTSTPEDPGDPGDPTATNTSTSTPEDPIDPTATPVPPTTTPSNPGSGSTPRISGTDTNVDPGLLIPVTGAELTGGHISRTDAFKNLGVLLLGFGLVMHGLYLRSKKIE